jgi:biotin transport system substrate-specific component
MLAGLAIVFIGGVSWLTGLTGSPSSAVATGFAPFIVADIVKVSLAALILPGAWKLLGTRQ